MQTIWSFKYTYVFYLSLCSIYNWLSLPEMKCWQVFYHIITEYPSSIITLQLLLAINLCCVHVRSHCSYHIQTKYGPSLPSGHERDSTHTRYPAIKAGINPHRPDTGNNVPTSITWRGPEACSQANSSGTGMSHCTTQWIYHHNDIIIPYMLVSMCKSLLIFFFLRDL